MDQYMKEYADWERFKARRHLEMLLSSWRRELDMDLVWIELDMPVMSLDNPLRTFNGIHSRD